MKYQIKKVKAIKERIGKLIIQAKESKTKQGQTKL